MIHDAHPQNYTVTTTVVLRTMSGLPTGFGVPTRPISSDGPTIGHIGHPRAALKGDATIHENMAVTNADQFADVDTESVEISLAALGVAVPETATVDVQFRSVGAGHLVLEIARRDDVYIIEGTGIAELTGVVGRDELPQRVPDWINPVAELFGIDEVQLGR